jgi:hypothetical protein
VNAVGYHISTANELLALISRSRLILSSDSTGNPVTLTHTYACFFQQVSRVNLNVSSAQLTRFPPLSKLGCLEVVGNDLFLLISRTNVRVNSMQVNASFWPVTFRLSSTVRPDLSSSDLSRTPQGLALVMTGAQTIILIGDNWPNQDSKFDFRAQISLTVITAFVSFESCPECGPHTELSVRTAFIRMPLIVRLWLDTMPLFRFRAESSSIDDECQFSPRDFPMEIWTSHIRSIGDFSFELSTSRFLWRLDCSFSHFLVSRESREYSL